MKKKVKKIRKAKIDIELLKHWKSMDVKTVFDWLEESISMSKPKKL